MSNNTQNPDNIDKTLKPDVAADKTLKPDVAVADKTLKPDIIDKTLKPDAAADKTLKPQAVADKTLSSQVADKTLRPAGSDASIKREIKELEESSKDVESEYLLNGVTYKTVKVLSTSSGEARILLVENKGQQYVLKLYYYGQHPDHEILEMIHKVAGSGLLVDIIAHGYWTNPKRTDEQLDFELMNYCSGGSLDKINLRGNEEKFREIAIRAASSIDFLNKHNILHRDIKPGNFFFTDDSQTSLVLGDFGIAVKCPQNGSCRVDTARTPIYAAPEFYTHVPGERPDIDIKSDYYSLGITLLSIWMGEANIAGSESVLLKNKLNETLPYPTDMSAHTLSLIKALTRLMPNKRCGFTEIVRWAKGENIFKDEKAESDEAQLNIVFNSGKKQVAHTPEELAAFMLADQELAIKYLYTGKITKWFNDAKRPELAVNIESIVETLYPKDKTAGLYAACYMLDPAMPYTDVKGKKLDSTEQIAQSLVDNFAHYSKVLSNPNDPLYIYLNVSGLKSISDTYPKLFKADSRRALWQLIYALNPQAPFYISMEDGKTVACNNGDEILKAVYESVPTEDSWDDLRSEMFFVWLAQRDPAVAGKIRSRLKGLDNKNMALTWYVLYSLNPKVSYMLQLDETASDYYFTHSQVADFINLCLIDYLVLDGEPDTIIRNLTDIKDTRLYYYFKSKEIYDDKIDWISYCMDVESKENSRKNGPYSWIYGAFKAIKGLDFKPYYYFPKSKILVTSLDELKKVPSSEIKEELDKRYLEEWIATFFQEDPYADLSQKFTYEKLTVKYLEFIEKLDKKNVNVSNFRKATTIVEKNKKKVRSAYGWFLLMRLLLGVLCFVPIIAFIVALIWFGLPFDSNPLSGFSAPAIIGMTILFSLVVWFVGDFDSCLGSVIVGAIAAVVVYYALYFALELIMPVARWIMVALLALLGFYILRSCYLKLPTKRSANKLLFNPTFEESGLEPLHFTYRAQAGSYFDSSIADASFDYVDYLKKNMKSFAIRAIPVTLLVCGLAYVFVLFTPALSNVLPLKDMVTAESSLQGEWTGTFEGRPATLEITEVDGDNLKAVINVQYSNMISEQLEGTVDMENMLIHFDDVVSNGNLDGRYDAILSDDLKSFEGMYENYTTKKQVKISFSK